MSGFAFAVFATSTVSASATTTNALNQSTEAAVRAYFADTPIMIEIARCESKFRQFNDSGAVLRGGTGGQMVGVFQFFYRYHESAAREMGFDIKTLDGNLAYVKYVYTFEGTAPWQSARDCWATPNLTVHLDSTLESDNNLRQKLSYCSKLLPCYKPF